MSVTFKEVLELDILKEAKVLTNIPDQYDFTVNAISAMEYPVEEFVRENEIVLTTCMSCDNQEIFMKLIEGMVSINATALFIALGCYIEEIPDEIIKFAEEKNLSLVSIPWELRFSDVVENVFSLLALEKNNEIETYTNLKDKLISKFLEKSDLVEPLNMIEKTLKIPVALFDLNKKIISKSDNFINNRYIFEENPNIGIFKLEHNKILFSYLFVDLEDKDIVDTSHFGDLVENNIINPLILWFERTQTLQEINIHYKEKFILDLVDDKEFEIEKYKSEGKKYGFNLEKLYVAIIGKLDYKLSEGDENGMIKNLKNIAIRTANSENKEILVAYRNTFLIILLENQDNQLEDFKEFIRKYEILVKASKQNLSFVWGIGGIYKDEKNIQNSYLDAIMSLKSGLIFGTDNINTVSTNTEYKIFSEIVKNDNIMNTIKKIIDKIIEEGSKDLIETLFEYYRNNRNISKTAESMFLHRQSLNYRLKKIENITEFSLDNPRDNFLLELCMKAYKYDMYFKL